MKNVTEQHLAAMREGMRAKLRQIAPEVARVMALLDHKWVNLPDGPRVPTVEEIIYHGDRLIETTRGGYTASGGFILSYDVIDHDANRNPREDPPSEIVVSINWTLTYAPKGCWGTGNLNFPSPSETPPSGGTKIEWKCQACGEVLDKHNQCACVHVRQPGEELHHQLEPTD